MYSLVHSFEKDATVAMELSYTLASKAALSVHGVCTLWRYLSNTHTLWYNHNIHAMYHDIVDVLAT